MTKKKNKAISLILLMIIILTNILPLSVSLAANEGDTVEIVYAGNVPYHLKNTSLAGQGYVVTALAGYYENGFFYPAYCVNINKPGVDSTREYGVTLVQVLENQETYNKIWRVVTAGYPYNSPEELGVSDWRYAYQATKMAVYCILGQSDLNKFYATDTEGQKIVDLIHRLVNAGNNGTSTYRTPVANINKSGDIQLSGNYYIQNYSVGANVSISDYKVIMANFPTGTKITNTAGTEKNIFASGEIFQVRIPKDNVETQDINGRLRVDVNSRAMAAFYGTSYNSTLQDYAVTGDPIALTSTTANLSLKGNTANIRIKKIDSDTKEPIKDTVYELSKTDGTVIGRGTTDNSGNLTFYELYQNDYILREVTSNDNYVISQENVNVRANYNKTTNITLENKHKEGNLKVYKVDKDNHRISLGNVQFDLFSEEFNRVIGTYTTDVNGEILVNNLRTGNYTWIEKTTNKWYNLTENTNIKVEWEKTNESTIENELKKGQVRVIKVDLDNNEVKLKGVKFNVLDKNNRILETIITNDEGEAITSKYPIRDFENLILQETETLQNYKLNTENKTIKLEENQIKDIVFQNEKKKGQIKVIKVDLDNNEVRIPNVEFNVLDENENIVDRLITNENGEATSIRLPIDQRYKVQETKTLENYVLNDEIKTVELEEDQITNITFENEKKKGQVKVIKVELDNNEVKIPNVEFNILDEEENIVDRLITNENGEATSIRLPIDQQYKIQETKTLENYVLNEETQTIILAQDEITDIVFANEKIKGYIEITKVSADDNKITNEEKGTLLKNAVFNIYNYKDEIVDTLTTNNEGKATSKLLEYGDYFIEEQNSGSDFYLLNTEKYNIEIRENLITIPITIENTSVDIGLDIDKTGIVQAQPNDEIKYSFNSLKNTSNVPLDNFTWIDNLPHQYIRITKLFTGTYNEDLDYIVKYKTDKSEDYIEFGKYNTQKNNYIDFTKIELQEDEYITDYKVEFGTVMPGFEAVEKPFIFAKVLPTVKAEDKWVNYTSLTGNYKDKELEDKAEWTTISYSKKLEIKKLPRTGF